MPAATARASVTLDDAVARLRVRAQAHGGDFVVDEREGRAHVRFLGACRSCPALPLTFLGAVEPALLHLEDVEHVTCDQVHVSAHAQERLRAVWAHRREANE
jgi:Fe-S cluster biogenesis protein NfuA